MDGTRLLRARAVAAAPRGSLINVAEAAGVSRATVLWAARRVVRAHEEPYAPTRRLDPDEGATRACAQCQPDGSCSLLARARAELDQERG